MQSTRRIILDLDERTDAALRAAAIRETEPSPNRRRPSIEALDRTRREQAARFVADGLRSAGYLRDERP